MVLERKASAIALYVAVLGVMKGGKRVLARSFACVKDVHNRGNRHRMWSDRSVELVPCYNLKVTAIEI